MKKNFEKLRRDFQMGANISDLKMSIFKKKKKENFSALI